MNNSDESNQLLLLGQAEMILQNWNEAINYYELFIQDNSLTNSTLRNFQQSIIADLGACYAYAGQMSRAHQLLEDVVSNHSNEPFSHYYKARILTIDGDFGKALHELQLSIQSGYIFNDHRYAFDYHLKPLFNDPTFRKLVQLKG